MMKGIAAFVLVATMLGATPPSQAAYPEKPVHIVVGFPPGSQPDIVARLLAQEMARVLGQPMVVDNIVGAAGNIAAERIARSAPDGYSIGLLSQTHIVVNPTLYKLAFDPARDFAPISQVTSSPAALVVGRAVAATTLAQLVELARAHPGELTFASSGTGSGTHVAAELFKSRSAIDIRHVPYKGVVAAIPDLLEGRVTMMFSPLPVVLPLVREGRLRALAVTSLHRSPGAPQLPTIAESGYGGFEATNWYGLLAPARTSPAIVSKLHRAAVKALAAPGLHAQLEMQGLDPIGNSPAEFAAAIAAEIPKWAALMKTAHITAD